MEEKTFISNNHLNGVFRVHQEMPIFQVRGYDMANISFPYVNRFRRKPGERPDGTAPKGEGKGAEYYPFDKDDRSTTTSLTVVEPESMPMCTGPQWALNGTCGTLWDMCRAWNSSYSCLLANSGGSLA